MNNPPPFDPPFQPPSKPIPGPPSPESKGWVSVDRSPNPSTSQPGPMDESLGDQSSKRSLVQRMKGLVLGSSMTDSSSRSGSSHPSTQPDAPTTSRPQSPPLSFVTPPHNHNLSTCIPKLINVNKPRQPLSIPSTSIDDLPPIPQTEKQNISSYEEPRSPFEHYYQQHRRRLSAASSSSSSYYVPTSPWYQPSSTILAPSTETVTSTDMRKMGGGTILTRPESFNYTPLAKLESGPGPASVPMTMPTLLPNFNSNPTTPSTEAEAKSSRRKGEEQSLFSQAADAVGSAWYPDDPTCYLPHELNRMKSKSNHREEGVRRDETR